ncbi:hypothetical protein C8J57DRAFT_1221424 [Mycena rebaudengoi]|nr:hypothetical protein C8J57DRAFT_1221424 [Mycena rebaudengoi]
MVLSMLYDVVQCAFFLSQHGTFAHGHGARVETKFVVFGPNNSSFNTAITMTAPPLNKFNADKLKEGIDRLTKNAHKLQEQEDKAAEHGRNITRAEEADWWFLTSGMIASNPTKLQPLLDENPALKMATENGFSTCAVRICTVHKWKDMWFVVDGTLTHNVENTISTALRSKGIVYVVPDSATGYEKLKTLKVEEEYGGHA